MRSSSAISTFGRRVGQAVLHLGRRPPGVEADDGGADRRDRPVADDPLGVVAHRQRDAVARAHAVDVAEVVGERPHLGVDLGVGVALVLVHEVVAVAEQRRQRPDLPHVRRCRVEHPRRDAPDVDLGHGEGAAGSDHLVPGRAEVLDHTEHDAAPRDRSRPRSVDSERSPEAGRRRAQNAQDGQIDQMPVVVVDAGDGVDEGELGGVGRGAAEEADGGVGVELRLQGGEVGHAVVAVGGLLGSSSESVAQRNDSPSSDRKLGFPFASTRSTAVCVAAAGSARASARPRIVARRKSSRAVGWPRPTRAS